MPLHGAVEPINRQRLLEEHHGLGTRCGWSEERALEDQQSIDKSDTRYYPCRRELLAVSVPGPIIALSYCKLTFW